MHNAHKTSLEGVGDVKTHQRGFGFISLQWRKLLVSTKCALCVVQLDKQNREQISFAFSKHHLSMTLQIFLPSTEIHNETLHEDLKRTEARREVYFYESIEGYIVCNEEKRKSDVIALHASVHTQESNRDAKYESNFAEQDISTSLTLDLVNVVFHSKEITVWKFNLPAVQPPNKRVSGPNLQLSCRFIEHAEPGLVQNEAFGDIVLPDYKPYTQDIDHLDTLAPGDSKITHNETETNGNNAVNENTSPTAELNIPIVMALVIKMKSTKPAGRNGMLLVALTIERSEEMAAARKRVGDKLYFNIESFDLSLDSCAATPMNEQFPLRMAFDDSVNIVYKLDNNEQIGKESTKQVSITMNSTVQRNADGVYKDVSDPIRTNWRPCLDLGLIAPPINNALKTNNNTPHLQSQMSNSVNGSGNRQRAALNTLYKMESPTFSSLNTNSVISNAKRAKLFVAREASSVTVNLSTNINSSLAGLRLTFIGRLDMKQGVATKWKMQAINNSVNRLNLSLLVQNPINFNPIYSNAAPNNNFSSSNLLNNGSAQKGQDIIIYNKAQLYSLYNTLKVNADANGVVIMNNDVRIGPLDPQTLFETTLTLVGNTKGIFSLDGLKIFDVATCDGLDFGKLIEVFVV